MGRIKQIGTCMYISYIFNYSFFFSSFQASQTVQVTKKVRSNTVTYEVCSIIKAVDKVMAKLLFPTQCKSKEYSRKIVGNRIKTDLKKKKVFLYEVGSEFLKLPQEIVEADSISKFKQHLEELICNGSLSKH